MLPWARRQLERLKKIIKWGTRRFELPTGEEVHIQWGALDKIYITGTRTVTVEENEDGDPLVDVNVYDLALAKYPDAATFEGRYTIYVENNVTTLRLDADDDFPEECTFLLVNRATIYGVGGNGGAGGGVGLYRDVVGSPGLAGSDALFLNGCTVTINNIAGFIFGGGGGGAGGGRGAAGSGAGVSVFGSGGDGGGGRSGSVESLGGAPPGPYYTEAAVVDSPSNEYLYDAVGSVTGTYGTATISVVSTSGGNGTTISAGAGGSFASGDFNSSIGVLSGSFTSGAGGNGGDYGEAGQNGQDGVSTSSDPFAASIGGIGGAAGKAIVLDGGTVSFDNYEDGNTSDRIKGAVS